MEYNKINIADGSNEPSVYNYMDTEIKKAPNYPLHPPMPASHHRAQVLHIPADYQSPERLGTVGN